MEENIPLEVEVTIEELTFLLGKKEIVIQKLIEERNQLYNQILEMSNAVSKK